MPRRRRLVYSLLAVLAFVGLVPLGSFAFKLMKTSRRALETSQQEIELQLASSIAGEIDSCMDGLTRQIAAIGDSFGAAIREQGAHRFEASLDERDLLAGMLGGQLVALRFTPLAGAAREALLGATSAPPELHVLFSQEYERLLHAPAAMAAREPLLSDPALVGPRSFAGIVVTVPVLSGESVYGVLQGFISMDDLWERVARARASGHEIFALDAKGNLFAHTDPAKVAARKDFRDSEIVQKFLTSRLRSKETVVFKGLRDGRRVGYLGAYDSTKSGWGIFVQVEASVAAAPIQEMVRDTVTWAIVALALAVIVAIAFAGKLSRPISQLASVSRAFAQGDFKARASIRPQNEIGELADTFNLMADEIQGQIEKLKAAAAETNDLFLGTIRALAKAIDAKDPYTRGHSVRVNKYAVIISRYMNLSEREIRNIHVASLLHDVGKIGIDDAILKKPAGLTSEEFEIMKQHPEKGAKIMGTINALKDIVPGMRHHHERYGGGGYPLGLKGDDIPQIARIINVADTFDAMTTHRPYQAAFPFEAAVARINELKGSVCDPKVVEAFNRAYQAGEFALEARQMAEAARGLAAAAAAQAEPVTGNA